MKTDMYDTIRAALFGVAVGDALGVPVEFNSREEIAKKPVTDMIGYGTYNLPPGTFSDDSSLAFCLAEGLTHDFNLKLIGMYFVNWYRHNFWTPRGHVFDIGIATQEAIGRLSRGVQPDLAGGMDVRSNGNGSLMRILPLIFYIKDFPVEERYKYTKLVSSLTHAHARSVIACFYYLEFACLLLEGKDKFAIYKELQQTVPAFLNSMEMNPAEIKLFDRILNENIQDLAENKIHSSGYVLHTLEASIWCLLSTDNYKEATLKAVNLGEDTDTTGAVTGGLAGLLYGMEGIPSAWLEQMARKEDIEDLARRVNGKLNG
ncbi:MAG: ADP-ribosylglycohydrolase family protein [Bacteroidetes bacterium]|jgi:ADP-ribosylglycohydrolase|nr:ADP-ribosylglycohydrolase family protein [Bacteroidota bacterium]